MALSGAVGESSPNPTTSNPKRRNRRRSKQPFSLIESPVVTIADQRTMAELLHPPTEGYAEPVVGLKKNPLVLFSIGKILFLNSSMNSFLPQERQISEMKFPTLNNVLVNRFMRHGTVTIISFSKLIHAVNQQTSDVTTAMTAILKQFQATTPPASVKAVEEICVTCGGAHPYYQHFP
ncbi:hypothetical protein Tco_1477384 [Tanacetum coccineum]